MGQAGALPPASTCLQTKKEKERGEGEKGNSMVSENKTFKYNCSEDSPADPQAAHYLLTTLPPKQLPERMQSNVFVFQKLGMLPSQTMTFSNNEKGEWI